MKKLYWVIGLCLCIVMLGLATACGGGGATTSASNPTNTTPPAQTTTPGGAGDSVSDILGRGESIDSIRYDLTMTVTGQETITMTIYQKQNKMREEVTVQGMVTAILIDTDAQTMYTYMPEQNMAMQMTYDAGTIVPGAWEMDNPIMDYNPTIIGTESIDGKSCTVISWEEPGTGSVKMWVWTEKGFPLKMEVIANGVTSTIEYSNISFADIPDSIFELPDGVTIINQ